MYTNFLKNVGRLNTRVPVSIISGYVNFITAVRLWNNTFMSEINAAQGKSCKQKVAKNVT